MSDKFDLEALKYKLFMEKFIKNRENDTRNNISVISSVCRIFMDPDFNLAPDQFHECVNKIMISCSCIMKMTELYTYMTKAILNSYVEFNAAEVNRYLKDFCDKCNDTLGTTASVTFRNIPPYYFDTNTGFLDYILLGCVRCLIIEGAFNVTIVPEVLENNDLQITFDTGSDEDMKPRFVKSQVDNELMTIIKPLAEHICGEFTNDNNNMKLVIHNKKTDKIKLSSPPQIFGKLTFTPFHNMLSDLSGYNFYNNKKKENNEQ